MSAHLGDWAGTLGRLAAGSGGAGQAGSDRAVEAMGVRHNGGAPGGVGEQDFGTGWGGVRCLFGHGQWWCRWAGGE